MTDDLRPVKSFLSWLATNSFAASIPFFRISPDSPTQRMTFNPAFCDVRTFLFIISSVSPSQCRRSEWPMITYSAPRSLSIPGDTSPVKAPLSSQNTSWAPSLVLIFFLTSAKYGNGGQITTSTFFGAENVFHSSRLGVFSFQFPTRSFMELIIAEKFFSEIDHSLSGQFHRINNPLKNLPVFLSFVHTSRLAPLYQTRLETPPTFGSA